MAAGERRLKAMIIGGSPVTMLRFRGALINELGSQGYEVVCVAPQADARTLRELTSRGMTRFVNAPLDRAGLNPLRDVWTTWSLYRTIRAERPDTVLTFNVKPTIYGTLAAWLARVGRRVAMIEGLGYAYTPGKELKRRVARVLSNLFYRVPCTLAHEVIVLNQDDRAFFLANFMRGREAHLHLVSGGVGVDLAKFKPEPLPEGPPTFVMISRLLKDKGVYEFAEAARLVKAQQPEVRFILVGGMDPNPSGVRPGEVQAWVDDGRLEYVGEVEDVRPWLKQSHVLVLPSYREGMPCVVMEAMAMGRACIVTDVPGCREAIEHERTGLLVAQGSATALAQGMRALVKRFDTLSDWSSNAAWAAEGFDCRLLAASTFSIVVGKSRTMPPQARAA